eukprot:PhF_6_TR12892/c0_g1_i1/m.20291
MGLDHPLTLSETDPCTKEQILQILIQLPSTDISFNPDPNQIGTMMCNAAVTSDWGKEILFSSYQQQQQKQQPLPETAKHTTTTSTVIAPPPPGRSLGWFLKLIDEIVMARLKQHQTELVSLRNYLQRYRLHDPKCDEFSTFVFTFLTKKFGLDPIVRKTCSDLLLCLKAYRAIDIEAQIFGLLLCSKKYDALDTLFYCVTRSVVLPHSFAKVDNVPGGGTVTRRYIWEQHVPVIIKQCCKDTASSFARSVRSAVRRWHDVQGRLPGLISDPNFYTPPYLDTHPYLGRSDDPLATPDCGGYYQSSEKAMEMHQLLMLLLINFKNNREGGGVEGLPQMEGGNSPVPPSTSSTAHNGGGRHYDANSIAFAMQQNDIGGGAKQQQHSFTSPADQRSVSGGGHHGPTTSSVLEVPLDVVTSIHFGDTDDTPQRFPQQQQHQSVVVPPPVDVYKGFEDWLKGQNKQPVVAGPAQPQRNLQPFNRGPNSDNNHQLLLHSLGLLGNNSNTNVGKDSSRSPSLQPTNAMAPPQPYHPLGGGMVAPPRGESLQGLPTQQHEESQLEREISDLE